MCLFSILQQKCVTLLKEAVGCQRNGKHIIQIYDFEFEGIKNSLFSLLGDKV